MSNITLAVRGTSQTARYSNAGATSGAFGTVTTDTDATAIGGSNLNLDQGSIAARTLLFNGRGNLPVSRAISVLWRVKFGYTGTPASNVALGGIGGGFARTNPPAHLSLYHSSSDGILRVYQISEAAALGLNNQPLTGSAFSADTSVWYDIVLTFTGDTTSNGCKLYINAVLQNTATSTQAWAATLSPLFNQISLGNGNNVTTTRVKINEFVIWDGVIDPTNVVLESGNGSLNGASRTSFVAASAIDGTVYTDPGVGNVLLGTAYTFAGVSETGTLQSTDPGQDNVLNGVTYKVNSVSKTGDYQGPSAANVKVGTAFGPSGGNTGTYNGSDRWSDPGVANVRTGTAYKANSPTNNETGTCAVPTADQVLVGVSVDNTTGDVSLPTTAQVASGVTFGPNNSETGTLNSVTNVLQAPALVGQSINATLIQS